MEKKKSKGRPKRYPEGTEIVIICRNVPKQHVSIVDTLIEELRQEIQIKKIN